MAMITRCPSCETAFRVHHHQLEARDGRVRCGRCAVVFDARLTLVAEAAPPPGEPAAAPQAPEPTPIEPRMDWADDAVPDIVLEASPEAADSVAEAPAPAAPAMRIDGPPSAPFSQPPFSQPPVGEAWRGARGAPTLPPVEETAEASYTEDDEYGFGPRRRRRARIAAALWGLAGLVLAVALALQAIYHFRSDIAAYAPELRGSLGRACEALGCDVPLPARASLITIEASEMQPDPEVQGVLALSAILRNRAAFAQRQPWLELTLTDAQDRAIARRVLAPRDYLGQRAEFEPAFAAGAEQSLRLLLDVDTLPARGYRLLVFYP